MALTDLKHELYALDKNDFRNELTAALEWSLDSCWQARRQKKLWRQYPVLGSFAINMPAELVVRNEIAARYEHDMSFGMQGTCFALTRLANRGLRRELRKLDSDVITESFMLATTKRRTPSVSNEIEQPFFDEYPALSTARLTALLHVERRGLVHGEPRERMIVAGVTIVGYTFKQMIDLDELRSIPVQTQ